MTETYNPPPEAKGAVATLREIGDALLAADSIVILSHSRPDGDAIGSSAAMLDLLKQAGKNVSAVVDGGVPELYQFLEAGKDIQTHEGFESAKDVLLVLDCSGKDRVQSPVWEQLGAFDKVINVDHHRSNEFFGDLNHVGMQPATGVIVHQLAAEMGWQISRTAADALFAAISTDTGSFRYRETTAETFRIGAHLLELGVDVADVSQRIYENHPVRRVYLLRELLQDFQVEAEGRLASIRMPLEVSRRLEIGPADTEGLIDIIRAIDTVIVSIFFEELPDGRIRVSTRSKSPSVDVGDLCAVFGGGGHQLAAGARLSGPLDEAADRVLKEATKRIHATELS